MEETKLVKEMHNLDLLELVCQLHSRALAHPSKEMHDAYVEARLELENRLAPQREDGFLKALDEKIKESKFISNKRKMAYYRGHYVALTELRDLYLSVTSKNKER